MCWFAFELCKTACKRFHKFCAFFSFRLLSNAIQLEHRTFCRTFEEAFVHCSSVSNRKLRQVAGYSDFCEKFVALCANGEATIRSFLKPPRNYFFLVVVDLKVESVFSRRTRRHSLLIWIRRVRHANCCVFKWLSVLVFLDGLWW